MKKSLSKVFSAITILALMLMALPMQSVQAAGSVSLTTLDSAYTQDFNTLAITGTANTILPVGWDLIETGGGTRDNEQYAADNGGSATGDTYSYGATGNTERAYGGLRSGTLIPVIGASFTNNTGATITTLDIAYIGEQWRAGVLNRNAADRIDFQLSTNATSLATGTWTDFDNLDFSSPNINASAGALDGNASGNRASISSSVTGLSVADGSSFWIRWNDFDISSSDDGLSIDDFSVTPHSAVLPNLTINDFSANEGNSGTTSFIFNVSLSAPAGPGGVTFDIATADGTAQDDNPSTEDNDYVAQSLTGQTIPMGSSGPYNFTVSVNGDVTDEPNETFFVNVTNVNGAAPTDGQGQGTILNDDAPIQPPAGSVVISEVYGGGGNTSAPFKNDYIELYNRTASSISLAGWSVQYASAAGTFWAVTNLTGSIGPGKYYLVAEAAGNSCSTLPCGVDLPTPDATGTIAMGSTAGKVALVQNSTALTGSCPTGLPISDFVGYGSTACFEGSGPTAAPSNTTSVIRLANGATDTDNNAADFATGTPDPDNSSDVAPAVASTTPANGAANVLVSSNIDVTFSEPVNATSSSFTVSCTTSGPHTVAVTGGPTTYTLNPDTDFVTTENCTITVIAAQVSDQDTDDPPDTMTTDFNFSFGTEGPVCEQTYTPIYSIQGSGATAAITGNVTTQGVVVGDFEGTASASGFYMQDLTGDGNSSTSDGIFVFTGASNLASVGDVVRVTGYARERFNQTALNGSNSNTDPVTNVVNCGTGSVPVTDVTLPFASATFPERYEGMYVRFPQALVIAEYFNYDRFGEIVLAQPLPGETRPFTGTAIDEPGAAANARTLANSLSRITLDDAQSAQNPPALRHPNGATFSLANRFRGGDTVQNAVGVLGFDFSLYRIFPTGPADYTSANPRPASPEPVGGTIRVAAMNTLNFFVTLDGIDDDPPAADNPADNICGGGANLECRGADASQPTEFSRQRDKLLTALSGLNGDIIGLNELENTPSVEPLQSITSGMPGYDYIHTGTIGTDAIKVGLIYRPAVVTPVGDFKLLTSAVDPRFIDTKSRPSLAQTFEVNATGAKFTVVVNHFKSKGSACNDVGDPDLGDGQGNCSQTRRAAAEALVDWLATDPTGSGDPDFLIMGDLNSYAMEDSIDEIKAGSDDVVGTNDDYTNLIANFHGLYAYSYTFDGQAGYLDHALANTSLFSQVTGAADWHINSDEPDVLDYDTSFKPAAQEALYEVNPYRTSDHDAVVIGLNLLNTPPVANNDSYSTNEDTSLTVAAPGVLANDTDAENNTLTAVLVSGPSHGTVTLNANGSFTYTPASNYNGPDSFTYKANDGHTDSNTATVSITVNAVNDAPVAANDSYNTNEDATLSVAAPGVLTNDTDIDNASLTAVLVTGPSHGSLTLNANGSFSYTPALNYNGPDSFTYRANDGAADSNIATVTITVSAVNDAPVATADTATVAKNGSVAISVLANDFDVDGDTVTVTSFTQPAHGTVAYSTKNKNFRYTPTKGFSGTDSFTYTISDGHGGTATATVTITVQ
jgi:uncharacterized protein